MNDEADFGEAAAAAEEEEKSRTMPLVLEAVNRGRALRGVPPIDKLPSFYDDPNEYA